jgi:hypothetical protein
MKALIKTLLFLFILLLAAGYAYAYTISIILPESNATIGPRNSSYPLFGVNVTVDSWANVTLMNITVNGNTVCSNTTVNLSSYICSWNLSLTGDGIYKLVANATNSTGGTAQDSNENITIDNTNASMTLNYPANNGNVTGTTINFNWTAIDNHDFSLRCNLTIDGVLNRTVDAVNNTATNVSVYGLAEGSHSWNVTCFDNAYNGNTSPTYTLTIDNTKPSADITAPANETSSTSASTAFTWLTIDNLATGMTCNVTANDVIVATAVASPNNTATSTTIALSAGTYNWNVTCTDPSGNSNTSATWVLIISNAAGGSSGGGNSASRFYNPVVPTATTIRTTAETTLNVYTYSPARISLDNTVYELKISRILENSVELSINNKYFQIDKNQPTSFDLNSDKQDELMITVKNTYFNRAELVLKQLTVTEPVLAEAPVVLPKEEAITPVVPPEKETRTDTVVAQKQSEPLEPLDSSQAVTSRSVSKASIIIAIAAILLVIGFVAFKHYY